MCISLYLITDLCFRWFFGAAARLQPVTFQPHWIRKLTREEKTAVLRLTTNWSQYRYNNFRYITLFDIVCTLAINETTRVSFTIPAGFLSDGFSSPSHVGETALVATPLEFIAHDYLFATHAVSSTQDLTMQQANLVFSNSLVVQGLNTLPQASWAWRKSFLRGVLILKHQLDARDRSAWQLIKEDWTQRPVTSQLVNTTNT